MSDQDTNNKKDPVTVAAAAQPETAPALAEPSAAAPRKPTSAVAWFALLLIIAMAAGTAWLVLEAQRREDVLVKRVAELETVAGQKESNLQALRDSTESQLNASIEAVEATLNGETFRLSKSLEVLEELLAEQRSELARFNAADRGSWLMAEVEYLLRLSNQRLIMAGDTASAQALLGNADKVLRELDDTNLHEVRGAVAADLAAVRAVPRLDVEGIYLRLSALIEQAGKLVIFQMPEREEQPRLEPASDWQGRLQQGYEAALAKLSDYLIIRRRDVPMQALMDPQWEGLVRQNLRMLLEQAQVALLSGNQTLYSESLERARHWVAEFSQSDESAARAIAREITQLADLQVAAAMPDLSRSLQALDDAVERRAQQGGGE